MYTCICGKTFNNPQSFNGHKSHCKEHQIAKHGDLESYTVRCAAFVEGTKKTKDKKALQQKQKELLDWLATSPKCLACGIDMTSKFGSGKFCSRACANKRVHSEETKRKIASSMANVEYVLTPAREAFLNSQHEEYLKNIADYQLSPRHCPVCNKPIEYKDRNNATCGAPACLHIRYSDSIKSTRDRIGLFNGHINYKWGYYEDIFCDSSWELAYIVYMRANGHTVTRNTAAFPYIYAGKSANYYPDFIVDGTQYVEIKNYWTEQVQAKIDQFPKNLSYVVLYRKDLKPALDYCTTMFGKQFYEILYDKTKPSYLNKSSEV